MVVGCGSQGPQSAARVFDPCQLAVASQGATDDQRASISDAIAMWQTHVDPSAPAVAVEFRSASSVVFGLYDDTSGTIFINLDLVDRSQRTITIAHELGHAFGLLHITDRPSVMNPGNLTIVPNAGDLAAVTARWGDCPR